MTRIYHNPRCSKSRAALELIRQQGEEPEIVLYLKDPPTVEELDRLCRWLGVEPEEIVRKGERRFKEIRATVQPGWSRQDWLDLLSAEPILIERPIVARSGQAVVGRPPESVLDLY